MARRASGGARDSCWFFIGSVSLRTCRRVVEGAKLTLRSMQPFTSGKVCRLRASSALRRQRFAGAQVRDRSASAAQRKAFISRLDCDQTHSNQRRCSWCAINVGVGARGSAPPLSSLACAPQGALTPMDLRNAS